MKRNTINQIKFNEPVRTLKKNKSCQLNIKSIAKCFKPHKNNHGNQFLSTTIASLFVNELLEQLSQIFRKSDEYILYQHLTNKVIQTSLFLQSTLNPIDSLQQNNIINHAQCQQEPQTINGDLMCGANTIITQYTLKKMPRISLKVKQQFLKKQKSQFCNSKSIIASKSQIKISKDQQIQIKRGFEALQKIQQTETKSIFEDNFRDKLRKDKKSQYLKQISSEKLGILPLIEEHSFDYDGNIFPIKRNSIHNVKKIQILNTTCKVINRAIARNRKQNISKLQGMHLKTQTSENQKQNKRNLQILSLRKHSNTESMKDLVRVCSEDEQNLKMKLEQSLYNKAIKIRQLKAN